MSHNCVCCGTPLPDSHHYRTCSVCYGDPDWGTDGILRRQMEEAAQQAAYEQWAAEREWEEEMEQGRER